MMPNQDILTRERVMKTAKPILFNTEMVRAIQDGTKTVTRRLIKPHFRDNECGFFTTAIAGKLFLCYSDEDDNETRRVKSPYQIGDILYVRETWAYVQYMDISGYVYRASEQAERVIRICADKGKPLKWHPSIHMPKEAARIFLRVTSVKVERLQDSFFKSGSAIFALLREGVDIGEQCRECIDTYGIPCCIDDESECGTLDEVRSVFSDLWNGTIKKSDLDKYGWSANPGVRVIEFERLEVK